MGSRRRLLDHLVALYPDRTREALYALILCKEVEVEGVRTTDPKALVNDGAEIALGKNRFVSRGGFKLEGALDSWPVPIAGRIWLDAGASTGGFTDCLLQRGATLVYAVDVGTNQLAWKIRSDPRVHSREKTNIMSLEALDPQPFGATADLAFRSLRHAARKILSLTVGNVLIALVKPQFEWLDPPIKFDGVVPDKETSMILDKLWLDLKGEGVRVRETMPSPVRGRKGNQETLVWLELIDRPSVLNADWNVREGEPSTDHQRS